MADNARDFSGTNQLISVTDPAGISVNAAWTWGAWIAPDAYGADGSGIALVGSNGATTRGALFQVTNGGVLRVRTQGQFASGATAVGTSGTWRRVGCKKAASGTALLTVMIDGADDGNQNCDAPVALDAGDVYRASADVGSLGVGNFDGKMAWQFWLQGVALSAANLDAYLNDPQSLVDDYGPSGTVTANALKILWPMQCDNATEEDVSGVGSDGTYTGPPTLSAAGGPSPSTPWDPCSAGVAYEIDAEVGTFGPNAQTYTLTGRDVRLALNGSGYHHTFSHSLDAVRRRRR